MLLSTAQALVLARRLPKENMHAAQRCSSFKPRLSLLTASVYQVRYEFPGVHRSHGWRLCFPVPVASGISALRQRSCSCCNEKYALKKTAEVEQATFDTSQHRLRNETPIPKLQCAVELRSALCAKHGSSQQRLRAVL
jgi:hypothetical protein